MESLQRTANRGSISTGYDVDNSVKFDDGNNTTTVEFFERNVSSAGSRTTATFSAWLKRTQLDANQYIFTFGNVDNDNGRTFARFQEDDTLRIGGGQTVWLNTNRVFRDTSAWYHIVVAIDTTSGTADNRIRLYVNGEEVTQFGTRNNPSQNDVMGTNFGKQAIGYNTVDNGNGFNGYMCEVVIQDGVASAPTEFGKFDNARSIWIPKDASGATMGTNGSYFKFENAASMGAASAGNAFTVQNINQNDQATDTCTNNFCTWSPLWVYATNRTVFQGATNLEGSSAWGGCKGTIGVTNGKWYWENKASGNDTIIGWQTDGDGNINSGNAHNVLDTIALYQDGNYIWIKDSTSGRNDTSASGSNASGQIIGFALDLDSSPQTATFYRNGSAIASDVNIDGLTGKTLFPFISQYNQNTESNFGGYTTISISSAASDENGYGTFEYAPPSGYYAICTKNLAEFG